MREVSFVRRLKFNFTGSITKKALVIGDADNDQHNELVCANLQGDLAIFKEKCPNRFAYATDLGMVTACVIGDVINAGRNYVVAINTEGWLFIFDVVNLSTAGADCNPPTILKQDSTDTLKAAASSPNLDSLGNGAANAGAQCIKLTPLYDQLMPANCKELLMADLDGDGQNELIVGLTDRVLRTYKWVPFGQDGRGKFVGLYKWEFADQIGAVSLNPSRHDNCQDIIVAQPGGTYARLECFDKKPTIQAAMNSMSSGSGESKILSEDPQPQLQRQSSSAGGIPNNDGDNVRTEYISKLTPEYHQLALAQMRNHHISTEVLGGIRDRKDSDSHSLIVIATLDGTLMLVKKDAILWSLQVDHQLFALAIIETKQRNSLKMSQSESTCTIVPNVDHPKSKSDSSVGGEASQSLKNNGAQYFAVCAWNGKTYIIDEERNYLRFKFDEAVSAFTAGNYHFDGMDHPSLVYATFNNQIILYYDVILDHIRPMYLLNEIINNPEHEALLRKLKDLSELVGPDSVATSSDRTDGDESELYVKKLRDCLKDVMYNFTDAELSG